VLQHCVKEIELSFLPLDDDRKETMFQYKIPTFEDLQKHQLRLHKLNALTELDIYTLWKVEGDNLQFQDGKASDLIYDDKVSLVGKMIFRFRSSPDMCYFWNAIDPYNRHKLLAYVLIDHREIDLDFFVWLGNVHCAWSERNLAKSTIATYFDAEEEQQRKWVDAFRIEMLDLQEKMRYDDQ